MFVQNLYSFIKKLKTEVDFDEWYLSEFIEKNIDTLSQEDAFQMQSYVIQLIEHNLESNEMYELLQIWIALQRQSGTMQKPLELINNPNIFESLIDHNSADYILENVAVLKDIYK